MSEVLKISEAPLNYLALEIAVSLAELNMTINGCEFRPDWMKARLDSLSQMLMYRDEILKNEDRHLVSDGTALEEHEMEERLRQLSNSLEVYDAQRQAYYELIKRYNSLPEEGEDLEVSEELGKSVTEVPEVAHVESVKTVHVKSSFIQTIRAFFCGA